LRALDFDAQYRQLVSRRQLVFNRGDAMTVCPIAIVAGCKKCPAYSICPLKSVLGDEPKADAAKAEEENKPKG
jgi:hypothetical protein